MFPIRDHEPSHRFPFITVLLIGINAVVFFLEMTTADLEGFINTWALIPATVSLSDPGSLIPFITSQFLHAGFAHILFNMWYLWIFGDNVEAHFGHIPYLIFYLLAGIAAALAQYLTLTTSAIPMLGASGAVAGVLGAYLALFPRHRVDAILPGVWARMTLPAMTVLFLWFATQLLNGTASIVGGTAAQGGTAWFAHIGGFAFGWIVAKMWPSHRQTPAQASFS